VLALKYNENYDSAISRPPGLLESTVRVHLLNARRKLKKELQAAGFIAGQAGQGRGDTMSCIWFKLLRHAVPFAGWRLRLCQRHVERCNTANRRATALKCCHRCCSQPGNCRQALISGGSADRDYQPRALRKEKSLTWRWAYAVVMAALLLGTSFWIIFQGRHAEPQPGRLPIARKYRHACARRASRTGRHGYF